MLTFVETNLAVTQVAVIMSPLQSLHPGARLHYCSLTDVVTHIMATLGLLQDDLRVSSQHMRFCCVARTALHSLSNIH